jgi:histidinol phosphatase-like PHP family hydrolase
MRIINKDKDFHMHSLNFSPDALHTIDEIAQYAGRIGLSEIIITDHSDEIRRIKKQAPCENRLATFRWRNVYNEVKVSFGVEADLLNEQGDVCATIGGIKPEFWVLSAHTESYAGDLTLLTDGYCKAIERFHQHIGVIGHLDAIYFYGC